MQILIAGLFPAVLLLIYIFRKDPQPEPASQLRKAVLMGVLICVPIIIVESVVAGVLFGGVTEPTSVLGAAVDAFCVAAIPEEGFKLLALWIVLRRNPYFDEHFDGIVYAVCVSLGFAAVENVSYLFAGGDDWRQVALMRAILAVPGHYAFGILMGYYYALYHFVDHSRLAAAKVLLVPVAAHGIYDTIAMSGQVNAYLGGISFIVLLYFCLRMHKFAQKKVVAHIKRDKGGTHA